MYSATTVETFAYYLFKALRRGLHTIDARKRENCGIGVGGVGGVETGGSEC